MHFQRHIRCIDLHPHFHPALHIPDIHILFSSAYIVHITSVCRLQHKLLGKTVYIDFRRRIIDPINRDKAFLISFFCNILSDFIFVCKSAAERCICIIFYPEDLFIQLCWMININSAFEVQSCIQCLYLGYWQQ